MDLYPKVKKKAKGCRNPDVRIKVNLFLLALKLGNVTEACERRGFSRQFYYRWWNRFVSSGFRLSSLEEKSRRPKSSPGRVCEKTERAIHYHRRKHYGARMIEAKLKREGMSCSRTTVCHVMNGRKKVKKSRRARLKTHQKRYELPIPGQRLQMDVKYVPCLVDAKKTYTYVAIDECTRWRFAEAFDSLDAGTTVVFLENLKRACPFPIHCIQTDNGQEFTYRLNPTCRDLIEHPVDTWCEAQGIQHRLIPPGVKELNGKVERSHRIDMQYFYWKAPTHTLQAFNRALSYWMGYYNSKRLHGGIGYLTPYEKLSERRRTLAEDDHEAVKNLTPELEKIRLKFLREIPISREEKLDRQILSLELTLQKLLRAA